MEKEIYDGAQVNEIDKTLPLANFNYGAIVFSNSLKRAFYIKGCWDLEGVITYRIEDDNGYWAIVEESDLEAI